MLTDKQKLIEKVSYVRNIKEREHQQCLKATVYERKNDYLFSPVGQPEAGGSMPMPAATKLSVESTKLDIGNQLVTILLASEVNYVYDESQFRGKQNVLELAGVKSSSAFFRNAMCVDIDFFEDKIIFMPMDRKGQSSRYYGSPDTKFNIDPDASPEEMGVALVKAFGLTGIYKGK